MAAKSIFAIVVISLLQSAQGLSYSLPPGTNISRKLNYTIFDESESKKIILELWVDRVPKAEKTSERRLLSGGGEHDLNTDLVKRFNGAVYLINQDLFSQDPSGKMDYTIDVGFHDKSTETDLTYNDGSRDNTKKVSPRDWLTFTFHLDNKDAKNGKWACIDGFSDYAKKDDINYSLLDKQPNAVDTENNCKLLENSPYTSFVIGNSRVTTKTNFFRKFKTDDSNKQDIEIKGGMNLAVEIKITDKRKTAVINPKYLKNFDFEVPDLDSHHGTTEIQLIVAAS